MAQVKNEEEKKKNTTKKVTKKTTGSEKPTTKEKKTTSKASAKDTEKKQATTKKSTGTAKKAKTTKKSDVVDKKVVAKEADATEDIKKEEAKKEPKTKSTKKTTTTKEKDNKTSTTTKKEKTSKTKSTKTSKSKSSKNSKTSKIKGKITKIIGSKRPEETVEEEDDVVITDANENNSDIVKIDDEEKMQLVENEVKKDLKTKNKLPKEEEKRLSSVVFENLCVAIAIMIYLFFIILGFINIKEEVYNVDLKVFSVIILVIAILLFERAYKKDNGKLCAFGIETLFLAIITMGFLYINLELQNMFLPITAIISLLFAIYYVAKSIYLYSKLKKKYFVDNMKDIIQKEEKE